MKKNKKFVEDKFDFKFIIGNEVLKRTLAVAITSKKNVLLMGYPDTQGEDIVRYFRENDFGIDVKFVTPCPCGYYPMGTLNSVRDNPNHECCCTTEQVSHWKVRIRKYYHKYPIRQFVEQPRIEGILSYIHVKKVTLEEDVRGMLKEFYKQCTPSVPELLHIIDIAIAMKKSEQGNLIEYIAEAMSYSFIKHFKI